ncbi:hypothetical protein CCP3SC1_60021 [Gammaproteobacteria bacterium]
MNTTTSPLFRWICSQALSPAEHAFLGTMILPLDEAEVCWQQWLNTPKLPHGGEDLLPLLHERSHSLTSTAPREVARRLTVAALLEERRGTALQTILGDLLTKMEQRGLSPLVLDGHVRPGRRLRHTASIDLLFPDNRTLQAATNVLGLEEVAIRGGVFKYQHPSGLPVHLYASTPPGLSELDHEQLTAAAQEGTVDGLVFRYLAHIDELALACLAYCGTSQPRWLIDAAVLVGMEGVTPNRLENLAKREPVIACAVDGVLGYLDHTFALPNAVTLRRVLPALPISLRQRYQTVFSIVGRRRFLAARQPLLLRAYLAWWALATHRQGEPKTAS